MSEAKTSVKACPSRICCIQPGSILGIVALMVGLWRCTRWGRGGWGGGLAGEKCNTQVLGLLIAGASKSLHRAIPSGDGAWVFHGTNLSFPGPQRPIGARCHATMVCSASCHVEDDWDCPSPEEIRVMAPEGSLW